MKRVLISALGLAALASSAMAADLPAQMPYKAPAYVPVFNWTGFYAGLNIGGAWGDASVNGTSGGQMSGIIGGGQVGYNWQINNNFLLGVEADFQGSGQKRDTNLTVTGLGATTITQEVPWFGTARARAGLTFDRHLVYVTGGAAWLSYKLSATAGGVTASTDTSKVGWTVGAGWEWMFAPQWSAKVEYLYLDTGTTTITLAGVAIPGARLRDNVVRVGVNYHFMAR